MKYTIWLFDNERAPQRFNVMCSDDSQAMATVTELILPEQSAEVRCQGRLVARIEGQQLRAG